MRDRYQESLVTESYDTETDELKADKVYGAIERGFSGYDVKRIYRVFLSSVDSKEMIILNYLRLGFSKKTDVSRLHGHPYVSAFQGADGLVCREVDKLTGLLRFEYLKSGAAYAPCEPDHDIIGILADHFSDRFRNEAFIIHDKRRNKAAVSMNGRWGICEFDSFTREELAEDEIKYQQLWRRYFDAIAIQERRNEKCQKNMMPVKYWKNLTEMRF